MKISIRLLVLLSLLAAVSPSPAGATSSNLVISQLYLGTGQSELKLRYQYIELFNRGTTAVALPGITLQYSQDRAGERYRRAGYRLLVRYKSSGPCRVRKYVMLRITRTEAARRFGPCSVRAKKRRVHGQRQQFFRFFTRYSSATQ